MREHRKHSPPTELLLCYVFFIGKFGMKKQTETVDECENSQFQHLNK